MIKSKLQIRQDSTLPYVAGLLAVVSALMMFFVFEIGPTSTAFGTYTIFGGEALANFGWLIQTLGVIGLVVYLFAFSRKSLLGMLIPIGVYCLGFVLSSMVDGRYWIFLTFLFIVGWIFWIAASGESDTSKWIAVLVIGVIILLNVLLALPGFVSAIGKLRSGFESLACYTKGGDKPDAWNVSFIIHEITFLGAILLTLFATTRQYVAEVGENKSKDGKNTKSADNGSSTEDPFAAMKKLYNSIDKESEKESTSGEKTQKTPSFHDLKKESAEKVQPKPERVATEEVVNPEPVLTVPISGSRLQKSLKEEIVYDRDQKLEHRNVIRVFSVVGMVVSFLMMLGGVLLLTNVIDVQYNSICGIMLIAVGLGMFCVFGNSVTYKEYYMKTIVTERKVVHEESNWEEVLANRLEEDEKSIASLTETYARMTEMYGKLLATTAELSNSVKALGMRAERQALTASEEMMETPVNIASPAAAEAEAVRISEELAAIEEARRAEEEARAAEEAAQAAQLAAKLAAEEAARREAEEAARLAAEEAARREAEEAARLAAEEAARLAAEEAARLAAEEAARREAEEAARFAAEEAAREQEEIDRIARERIEEAMADGTFSEEFEESLKEENAYPYEPVSAPEAPQNEAVESILLDEVPNNFDAYVEDVALAEDNNDEDFPDTRYPVENEELPDQVFPNYNEELLSSMFGNTAAPAYEEPIAVMSDDVLSALQAKGAEPAPEDEEEEEAPAPQEEASAPQEANQFFNPFYASFAGENPMADEDTYLTPAADVEEDEEAPKDNRATAFHFFSTIAEQEDTEVAPSMEEALEPAAMEEEAAALYEPELPADNEITASYEEEMPESSDGEAMAHEDEIPPIGTGYVRDSEEEETVSTEREVLEDFVLPTFHGFGFDSMIEEEPDEGDDYLNKGSYKMLSFGKKKDTASWLGDDDDDDDIVLPAGALDEEPELPMDVDFELPEEEPDLPVDVKLPMMDEPELPMDEEPELPMMDEPELPMDEEPELPMDEEPELPMMDEPELPMDEEPELPMDDEPELPMDEEPELAEGASVSADEERRNKLRERLEEIRKKNSVKYQNDELFDLD